jgi:hypothetical protein
MLALGLVIVHAAAAYSAPADTIRSGGWSGGRYPNERSKPFQYCGASAKNSSDITMNLSLDRDYRWRLAFSHPHWEFVGGSPISMTLGLGGGRQGLVGVATVANPSTLDFQPEDPLALFPSLWTASQLKVVSGGFRFEFELLGASDVLTALTQCVWRQLGRSPRARPANPPADVPGAIRDEAKGVAEMLIAYARFTNPNDRSPPALQSGARSAAAWQVGLVTSTIDIVPAGRTPQPDGVTVEVIDTDARNCRGGFFFAKSSQVKDSVSLGRVFTSCQSAEASALSYYVVAPRAKGGFYLFSSRVDVPIIGAAMQQRVSDVDARIRDVLLTAIRQAEEEQTKAGAAKAE